MIDRTTAIALVVAALAACSPDPDEPNGGTPDGGSGTDSGTAGDVATDLDSADAGTADASTWDGGPDYLPRPKPGRHSVTITETRQIVPGDGLPDETPPINANNNLDVVRHDGRVYLAWRTAVDHYASEEVFMHVVSSEDELEWQYETTVDRGRDVREPRFLSLGDNLYLYMTELGTSPLAFEPNDVLALERTADGTWSEPISLGLQDTVLWRSRVENGVPYIIHYLGGSNIYAEGGELEVFLDTTSDGITLEPVNPDRRAIMTGGISETDFAQNEAGDLVGVGRNEAGDEGGFGSRVCTAPASDITDWSCETDPRKFDSPLMFYYDGEYYLVARRNVTPDGKFDLGREDLDPVQQFLLYHREYKTGRKRCSIWRWVPDEATFGFLVDLPSRGDTCFPGLIETATPGEFAIYNYSSPIDGEDGTWNAGQKGETRIYRHLVRFETSE